jgi:fatty acid desaturase
VTTKRREVVADWIVIAGALVLFGSLFLTWSHQFSHAFIAAWGSSSALRDVPRDPTAWQLYSTVDVLLALLAAALVAVAAAGGRGVRLAAIAGALLAGAFTLHALAHPPTNGANIFQPSAAGGGYVPNAPGAGPGETVAIIGLAAAIVGLGLSFTAD